MPCDQHEEAAATVNDGPSRSPSTTRWGDRTLAAAAAIGERAAFESIVHRYGPLLYGYARRMMCDQSAVDDIVQETFVAAWRQIHGFRADASIKTWLFRICDSKIADSGRLRYAEPIDDRLLEPLTPAVLADPSVMIVNAAFLQALERALSELPVRQRAVWVLREIDGLTFPQIGTTLALSPGAARGHHLRAQITLRQRMSRWQQ